MFARIRTWLKYRFNRDLHRLMVEQTREALEHRERQGRLNLKTPRPDDMPPQPVTPTQYTGAESPWVHGHPGRRYSTACRYCNPSR